MSAGFRRKHRGYGFIRALSYDLACFCWRVWFRVLYRARIEGHENIPSEGAVLFAANHQSFYDPPLIGSFCLTRRMTFVARAGLFNSRLFGAIIRYMGAVPVPEEDQSDDAAAMKASIKALLAELAQDRAVLIFPEGSRTHDGAIQPFDRGVALLAKRARCPILPVVIEGVFDAWARGRSRPKLFGARIAVRYGEPIDSAELLADGADAGLDRLARTIDAMRMELRDSMRERTKGRHPAPGPADEPLALPESGAE